MKITDVITSTRILAFVWILLTTGIFAVGQTTGVTVHGQIFLPSGQPIQEVVRFTLTADDPRYGTHYHFTDGQGRFILRGLGATKTYTIEVNGDGVRYATTSTVFYAQHRGYVPVSLLPVEEQPSPAGGVISVRELARPKTSEAARLHQEALAEIKGGRFKQAEDKLRRALALDPDRADAWNELAVLQMGKKDYAAAEKMLRKALEKHPRAILPLINLGVALNHQARHEEALGPLRQALELGSEIPDLHVHLGIALLETDAPLEAEPHLVRGCEALGHNRALAFLYLGKLHAQAGNFEKARSAWKSYLEMDPDSPNAQRIRLLLAGFPPS